MNVEENSRKLNISKKKKYTVIEGMKLYETMTNHRSKANNPFTKIVSQNILPERTQDSLKNFWKKM